MNNTMDIKRLLKHTQTGTSESRSKDAPLVDMGSVKPYYQVKGDADKTLVFESRFESGNLFSAVKVADDDYNLLLQNDVNTSGHT